MTLKVKLATIVIGLLATAPVPSFGQAAVQRNPRSDNARSNAFDKHVIVVYFNPADREPLPGYQERIDRIMTEIQTWYREQMKRNGFGPLTFPLERDENGRLVIHVVKGNRAYAREEEITTREIRDKQVKPALRKEGLDVDREHLIIFQNLLFIEKKPDEIIIRCWAPYCGGGDHTSGTAWVTDFELLDPLNLPKKTPKIDDAGRHRTLGNYMVAQLGGVAHEFGHSLGLPHNMQTEAQLETLGWTLMGDGNYHLFAERAGEEKGAYLSKPHATVLSSHPLFKRNAKDIDVEPVCKFHDLRFEPGDKAYAVSGRVESNLPAYAVLAYHDRMQHRIDYDATSWVSEVDRDGRFEVRVADLKPGWYELRLRCYLVNGARQEIKYRFILDDSLKIPAAELARQTIYQLHAQPAIAARDPKALLAAIEKLESADDVWYRRARAYHRVMTHPETEQKELSTITDDVREVLLPTIKWESARVGWEKPACNYVPGGDMPLESGDGFHTTGIYAHADSSYVYHLGGKWKKFTSGYGLQNLCEGSVVFVVKCDGRERFRSDLIRGWKEEQVEVDLTDVDTLELIVEDGGNGKWADCGIWFSPRLAR
jgi:hypothetical protein